MYSIIQTSETAVKEFSGEVRGAFAELRADLRHMVRYWLATEVHVYAFSIAANVLLSFFPFMLVMIALCNHLLGWPNAADAIFVAVRDYFPGETGQFLERNLRASAGYQRSLEWVSILLLLFTANGVFLPLEVALNRAWGVNENRSLVKNQLVSLGLIFACGALALLSAIFTGSGEAVWDLFTGGYSSAPPVFLTGVFKVASAPLTVAVLFLVYWLLPNAKVPWRQVLPRAVVVGLALEAMKWINLLIWPWLYSKFRREYGPFVNSVTILTWSFLAAMVVLGGADWTARRARLAVERAGARV